MLTKKNVISSILSLGLGFFLVWLILRFTNVNVEEIVASFYSLNPLYAGAANRRINPTYVFDGIQVGLSHSKADSRQSTATKILFILYHPRFVNDAVHAPVCGHGDGTKPSFEGTQS